MEKRQIFDADVESYSRMINLLGTCTDDHLFLYDFKHNKYTISEGAKKTFKLDDTQMCDAVAVLKGVVYAADWPMLERDLAKMQRGELDSHDLEYRWMGRDGHPIWINCRGQVLQDEQGRASYLIGRITDLGRKSKIDNVTGLYRENSLKNALSIYSRQKGKRGFLLQIGIDNFKDINEKYGQEFGDVILENTAQCILKVAGEKNKVFRLQGDEMIVLATDYPEDDPNPVKAMYKNIRHLVDECISESGYHLFFTISAGSVSFQDSSEITEKLIVQAGFALHQAKLSGKNNCVQYTQEVYNDYVHTLDVQECLRQDIENNFHGFELYYQPVVNIPKKKIMGAEALIRWNSDKFGFMSPVQFVPLLEESGLIIPLGRWIARTALEQCQRWQQQVPGFRINVNLSFVQLKKSDALKDILELIEELDIDKNMVMFEVTESGELETGSASQVLRAFKNESIHLAIDDFGTGYSNLRYVRSMTFDLLKIDQSFIRNIRENEYDYLVVKQFTELAHALNLTVCYEGVETKEDLECVLELNPDYIQGYYFSRPVPAGTFEQDLLTKEDVI